MNFTKIISFVRNLRNDEKGVTAIEYGLIAATVVVIGLATIGPIGGQLAGTFTSISGAL